VEWHQGELFPRVGFIVTNLSYPPKGIIRFYNGRGTAEQWIKEGRRQLHEEAGVSVPTPSRILDGNSDLPRCW